MGTQQVGIVFSDGSVRAAGNIPGFTTSGGSFVTLPLTNVVQFAPSSAPSTTQSNAFDCILLNSGVVQCWGDNTFGQLGNGTNTSSNTPTTVGGLSSTVIQIAVGQGHACALTATNPSAFYNANVSCWGRNDHGQLGLGNTTNVNTPHSSANGGLNFVVASAFETCENTANCFGQNANGQIGNNSTTDQTTFFSGAFIAAAPTVAVGQAHACAVRDDGTLFCWGANGSGQLGLGNTTEQHVPTAVTALSGVVQVAASLNTTCARRNDGSVWCWGDGTNGAVGDGTGTTQTSPVQAVGLPASSAIYGGGGAFCSISKNQTVWCWGSNSGFQLASGMLGSQYVPTQLSL
jgi:alpha-tubulin suppressor-like RCC1 family protein